jgi:hypothetical protein
MAADQRSANPNYLSGSNDAQSGKSPGYEHFQVPQPVCGSAENQQGNFPAAYILLIGNTLIDGYEDIESSCFGGFEQISILQSCQIGSGRFDSRNLEIEAESVRRCTRQ